MIMKKIYLLLILFAAGVSMKAQTLVSGGLTYRLESDTTVAVTRPQAGSYSGVVMIPTRVNFDGENLSVTAIDSAAFAGSAVTHVVVPNGVSRIGPRAFADATDLQGVTLPATLSSIEAETFKGSGLSSLAVPEGVTRIGERALADCGNLRWLFLPESLEAVGTEAFDYCLGLSEIHLASSQVLRRADAFRDLRGTDVVTRADSVTVAYEESDEWQDVGGVTFYTADDFEVSLDPDADVVNGNWAHFSLPEGLAYAIYDDVDSLIGVASSSDVYVPILDRDVDYTIVPTTLTRNAEPLVATVPRTMMAPSPIAGLIDENQLAPAEPNIYASGGVIYITGDNYGKWVWIHDVYGQLWLERPAREGNVGCLPPGRVYVVRVGDTVKKVVL